MSSCNYNIPLPKTLQPLQNRQSFPGGFFPRIKRGAGQTLGNEGFFQTPIMDDFTQSHCHIKRLAWVNQNCRFAANLGNRSPIGGDNRNARSHRLEQWKTKTLKKAGKDKKLESQIDKAEEAIDKINNEMNGGLDFSNPIEIKASKPISNIKKGDKVKVDGKEYEVDSHYTLIDHGTTQEMAIELFDSKTDKDYQLRYFHDQGEATMEFYELQEIMYLKRVIAKVEW